MWMPKEVNFLLALEDHYNLRIFNLYDKPTNALFTYVQTCTSVLHQPVAVTPVTYVMKCI